MSQYENPTYDDATKPISGWVAGGIGFAASMMVVLGIFQAVAGLAAILDDGFFVVGENYAFDLDPAAWGWIHLLIGVVVFLAGLGLFAGQTWAAVTAMLLAMLSMVANFFWIPYYPFWSLLVIALDAWVIWALTRPGAIRT
jgi:hypothetical protein